MTDADTTSTPAGPGFLRRLLDAVGRGLRAIFRPAVIVSLSAVVAAAALVVVAVEQREQTDWQRRQTCLAWFQMRSTDDAGLYASDPASGSVYDERADRAALVEGIAAERCGSASEDDIPGADTSAGVERRVQDLIDAYDETHDD